MSLCPPRVAAVKAVAPALSFAFTSAPRASRSRTISALPREGAYINVVVPSLSPAFGFAPLSSSRRAISTDPRGADAFTFTPPAGFTRVEKLEGAPVFALTLKRAGEGMDAASTRLQGLKTDEETLRADKSAAHRFQQLIDALKADKPGEGFVRGTNPLEVIELRLILEPALARLAAVRAISAAILATDESLSPPKICECAPRPQ